MNFLDQRVHRKGKNVLPLCHNFTNFYRRQQEISYEKVLLFSDRQPTSWNRNSPRSLFEHARRSLPRVRARVFHWCKTVFARKVISKKSDPVGKSSNVLS